MDQSEAPILDALVDYRKAGRYGFTPPGHRQGHRQRVLSVLGREPFHDDLLVTGGLDDRRARGKVLQRPPSPYDVDPAWERYPDAAGALIVGPSPYGTCADIEDIAAVCHDRGKPLIVDGAWGAHLPFHEDLPTRAMDAGADVCVVSVHKMGAGFEHGSVFHLQGELVDQDRLSACADLLMTTSPNVMVYAAIDGWRRQMVEQGHELLSAALDLAGKLRDAIELIPDLQVLDDELIGVEASHDLDCLQVMMDLSGTGTSGYQASDWLRENRQIEVGMSDTTAEFLPPCRSPTTSPPPAASWTRCGRGARPHPPSTRRHVSTSPHRPISNWKPCSWPAMHSLAPSRRCLLSGPAKGSPPNKSRRIRRASLPWFPVSGSMTPSSTTYGRVSPRE